MKFYCLISISILMISFSSHASETYQSELFFSFGKEDIENRGDFSGLDLGYQYNFTAVKTKNYPLREAAFLERASQLTFTYGNVQEDGSNVNLDLDSITVSLQYMINDSPFSVTAIYRKSDFSFENISGSGDDKLFGIGFGYYILKDAQLLFLLTDSEASFSSKVETDSISLGVKKVSMLGQGASISLSGFILNNETSFESVFAADETDTILRINAVYYINRNTGFGIELLNKSSDDSSEEGKEIGFLVDSFITNRISVGFELSKFSASNSSGVDGDSMELLVTGRF